MTTTERPRSSGHADVALRGSRQQWLLLLLTTTGLAALLIAAQIVLTHFAWRFDFTPGRAFTLSPHALQVLGALTRDVSITAFVRADDNRNRDIDDLLRRVRNASAHVRTAVVDLNRNPAVARHYGIGTYAGFVVESGGRRRNFENPSETLLIASVLQVTREARRVVYFLSGHGEADIDDSDRLRGYSLARLALTQELYDVRRLDLLHQPAVPEDADVVVIAGPRRDPLAAEIDMLAAYIAQGGALLVLLEPRSAPVLANLLATYGVKVDDSIVVDSENRLFAGDYLTVSVPQMSPRHPISSSLAAPPLFSGTRAIGFGAEVHPGVRGLEILHTAPSSWRSSDPEALRTGEATFVPQRDERGPQPVGVTLLVHRHNTPDDRVAHIVVLGDSDFASNFFLDTLGNKDLLVDCVNWLSGEAALLGARAQARTPGVNQFFLTDEQGMQVFVLGTVFEPVVVLLLGAAVAVYRRWRA